MPWRHPVFLDDFTYCFRPRDGVLISHERHRSDFARTVAILAFALHDPGHVLGVGDRPFGFGLCAAGNNTAGRGAGRLRHRLTREHGVDCVGQLVSSWGGPLVADAELIVDPTKVPDSAFTIE